MKVCSTHWLIILTLISFGHEICAQKISKETNSYVGFIQGYYYNQANECIDGLIRFEYNQNNFFLYKEAYGNKTLKVKAKDVKAFVVLADSFAVLKKFEIDTLFNRSKPLNFKEGFAKVIEKGEVILYRHQAVINFRIVDSFILTRSSDPKKTLLTVRKRDSNWFAENLAEYFRDHTDLSSSIKNKELGFKDLRIIVQQYNKAYSAQD